jgi:serine/threonine-protein kinase
MGGYAKVFSAWDEHEGQMVAIKFLSHQTLHQEAEMLSAVSHPYIPHVVEVFEEEGIGWLVQEFVAGPNLEEYLHLRGGRLSWQEALTLGLWLSEVLDALHVRRIMHLDVKPGNVLLVPGADGHFIAHAKLADFGLAGRVHPADPPVREAFGTPEYCAPERRRGINRLASDVYSLGVVLHEVISGVTPRENQPFHWTDLPGNVDGALELLIRQMTDGEPALRPTSEQVLSFLRLLAPYALPLRACPPARIPHSLQIA